MTISYIQRLIRVYLASSPGYRNTSNAQSFFMRFKLRLK